MTVRFTITGAAVLETVIHRADRKSRTGIGGVGGQMASALANRGCQPTLLHNGTANDPLYRRMLHVGIALRPADGPTRRGWSQLITGPDGETEGQEQGFWPPWQSGPALARQLAHTDWLLLDCNTTAPHLRQALRWASQLQIATILNATTTQKAYLVAATRKMPKTAITMNAAEADRLKQLTNADDDFDLQRRLNTTSLLITRAAKGWTLYRHGTALNSPTAPLPPGSDTIGCGDYATAGLALALATKADPATTINAMIRMRLKLNRPATPNPSKEKIKNAVNPPESTFQTRPGT